MSVFLSREVCSTLLRFTPGIIPTDARLDERLSQLARASIHSAAKSGERDTARFPIDP
jgi:hypothetical protein